MSTITLPSARRNMHALLANTFHHISPTAIVPGGISEERRRHRARVNGALRVAHSKK
jgi:hypothetical protein